MARRPRTFVGRDPRLCSASSSNTRQLCRKWAIRGGHVCPTHGGSAPQVRRKALERLEHLIDPERVLRQAAALAYSDIRDAFTPSGNLITNPHDWPAPFAAAVA